MRAEEVTLRVRYQETDQMGVVYHANYIVWMEVGRADYFRKLGMPYTSFEKNHIYLPVIRVFCEYKSPSYYDDELRVVTRIASLKEVKIGFHYDIFREQTLLATGETEHAFVNNLGKPLVLKKHNPFLWRRLVDVVEGMEEK